MNLSIPAKPERHLHLGSIQYNKPKEYSASSLPHQSSVYPTQITLSATKASPVYPRPSTLSTAPFSSLVLPKLHGVHHCREDSTDHIPKNSLNCNLQSQYLMLMGSEYRSHSPHSCHKTWFTRRETGRRTKWGKGKSGFFKFLLPLVSSKCRQYPTSFPEVSAVYFCYRLALIDVKLEEKKRQLGECLLGKWCNIRAALRAKKALFISFCD